MYSDEQSRINAVISYFFLWPFILLAKRWTPLADPYVRSHAKRSSIIIGSGFLALMIYFFLRRFLDISLIWINLKQVVMILIMGAMIFFLMKGAYRAYHGVTGEEIITLDTSKFSGLAAVHGVFSITSEEEKIRILASMIPLFGIFIAKKYPHELTEQNRIVGSGLLFLYFLALSFSGGEGFSSFLVLVIWILFFVIEAVLLFVYGQFLSWKILEKIPSYRELEAFFLTSFLGVGEFVRVSIWGKKSFVFSEKYFSFLEKWTTSRTDTIVPYFMPAWLLGIPFWNLFGIPSLFIEKYTPYRKLVIQWLIITLLYAYFFFFERDFTHVGVFILLFPIVHIMVYGGSDPATQSPFVGLLLRLYESIFVRGTPVSESASYVYTAPEQGAITEIISE